jgi:hypothetical protein
MARQLPRRQLLLNQRPLYRSYQRLLSMTRLLFRVYSLKHQEMLRTQDKAKVSRLMPWRRLLQRHLRLQRQPLRTAHPQPRLQS